MAKYKYELSEELEAIRQGHVPWQDLRLTVIIALEHQGAPTVYLRVIEHAKSEEELLTAVEGMSL